MEALLFSSFFAAVGCTCGDAEQLTPSNAADQRREPWLEACIPSPQRFFDDIRSLTGPAARDARIPETLDQLASRATGLSEEQIRSAIDWQAPLLFIMYEPPDGRPSQEAYAIRARRSITSPHHVSLTKGPRILEPRDGQSLFVDADGQTLFMATSHWALSAVRAHPIDTCPTDRSEIEVRVTRRLMESRHVVSWVERQGAWLETSAREATARRGRPTLGDPEVLARMLARWGEETRARAEASAPLRITLAASPETLQVTIEGRRQRQRESQARSSQSLLRAIAPDAYLAALSQATVDERQQLAHDIVDILAQIAGDRMPQQERDGLETSFSKLASVVDGQVAVALRPALEPGPLVGLAVVECDDPEAASLALVEATQRFEQGSLQNLLEHIGAHVKIGEPRREPQEESIAFTVTPPSDVSNDRGKTTRRLLGKAPKLAWRRAARKLLVAFGNDPGPELSRLAEAVTETGAASILTQPVLARAVERRPQAEMMFYGWLPSVAGLITQGGPGAGSLPPGGLAVAIGDLDDDADSWHATVLLDGEQLRSLIRWYAEGSGR